MQAARKTTEIHGHRRRFGRAQDAVTGFGRGEKQPGVLCCKDCGVVYRAGVWHWAPRPVGARSCECPACQRIRTRSPAGLVRLAGVATHAEEMKHLARHQEEAEKGEHPLNRIIAIEENAQGLSISTTDIHLPRRIGQAIRRAYGGVLRVKFEEAGDFVTVNWVAPGKNGKSA